MNITVEHLTRILVEILTKDGVSNHDSTIVANEIIFAQISGKKSHGLLMLKTMLNRSKKKITELKIIKDSENFCLIDGGGQLGPVVAQYAMDISIEKTKKSAFSLVAVRNPSPFLTAGYHVWNAADRHKLIALNISVAKSKVAPFGSIEPIFGTNPIGFAFPTKEYPILIDMSVTNIPAAKINQALEANQKLPENVAISKSGNYTTDPQEALDGALTTFGGYKGSAIALIVELMAGAFLNAKCGKQNGEMRTMLFMTIKPDIFYDSEIVINNASNLRMDVNNSKNIGSEKVRLPGDLAHEKMQNALKDGITLTKNEQNILLKYGAQLF